MRLTGPTLYYLYFIYTFLLYSFTHVFIEWMPTTYLWNSTGHSWSCICWCCCSNS